MRLGIIDMIGLAATLIFALPVANFGVTRLLAGETVLGATLLIVAVAMVAVPHYFMDPRTIFAKVFNGLLPGRFRDNASTDDSPKQ